MSLFLQMKMEHYSRFTLQRPEDGERHAEINLCEDVAETDDQAGGSSTFRPVPLQQNRLRLCFFVLGLLLIFAIGRIVVRMKTVVCVQLRSNLENNTCPHTHTHTKPSSLSCSWSSRLPHWLCQPRSTSGSAGEL